jgi:dihydrofolate synthase/folylpolyglutamate synthase
MVPSGASLSDWLERLESFSPLEIDLGLERMQTMLTRLQPMRPAHVFLVAGTNGKGSSVAMCSALLRAAGQRVGAYTSPHLYHFRERIEIDARAASDQDIVAAFAQIESCRDDLALTYFEYTTLAAVLLFAAAELDVWILEIGLGGRLDASNAIEPTASLITTISLDHCEWLGDTVEQIATEKAGIMRADTTTVFADADMPAAIGHEATKLGAHLLRNGLDYSYSTDGDRRWSWRYGSRELTGLLRPGMRGEPQLSNAAGVLSLLASNGFGNVLGTSLVNRVLPELKLAGRLQRVRLNGRNWLFDVAHNAAAAEVLAAALADDLSSADCGRKSIAIVGVMQEKDVEGVLEPLLPHIDRWIAVAADNRRALATNLLARRVANASGRACLEANDIGQALEFARRISAENDRIVVTGSFLIVGPALKALGLLAPGQIHRSGTHE